MKTHEQDRRRYTPSDASVLGRGGGGDKPVADDDVGTGCGGVVARYDKAGIPPLQTFASGGRGSVAWTRCGRDSGYLLEGSSKT